MAIVDESLCIPPARSFAEVRASKLYRRCRLGLLGGPGMEIHIDPNQAPLLFELQQLMCALETCERP